MSFAITFTVLFLAILESWLQPWLSIIGISIPLALIGLLVARSKISLQLLPWLGLGVGLILDFNSLSNFGTHSLFYLLISWAATASGQLFAVSSHKKKWLSAGVFIIAALIQPWYILVVNRQFEINVWETINLALIRTSCVAIPALIYSWLTTRKEQSSL